MLKDVPKAFVGQTDGQSLVVTKDAYQCESDLPAP